MTPLFSAVDVERQGSGPTTPNCLSALRHLTSRSLLQYTSAPLGWPASALLQSTGFGLAKSCHGKRQLHSESATVDATQRQAAVRSTTRACIVCHIARFATLFSRRASAAMERRQWAFCAVCCLAALCWLGQPAGAQLDYPLKGQSFATRPIPALAGSSRLTINATALLERALSLHVHDNSYQVSQNVASTILLGAPALRPLSGLFRGSDVLYEYNADGTLQLLNKGQDLSILTRSRSAWAGHMVARVEVGRP